jgi:CubicO group peptidase (beta-lactamase class C family)
MNCLVSVMLGTLLMAVGAAASPLQTALQQLMDEKVKSYQKRHVTAFQLSWKSATEEFTVASGTAGSRKIATDDTFLYGSGAKPFTAAMIMKRWEEGKLNLNKTVSYYVDPLFKAKLGKTFVDIFGSNATTMTVWHLVAMESGIPDFDVPEYDEMVLKQKASDPSYTPLDIVLYGATQPWNCMPGGCKFYSSTNYVVLGYVLLAVDGKSIDDWASLDQRHVAPLSKYPDLFFANSGPVDKHLTVPGYSTSDPGTAIKSQNANIMGWTCGNLVGTTRGMASWMWDLLVDRSVVGPKGFELMSEVQPISFGWGKPWLNYGAGLFVQQLDFSKEPPHYGDWGTTLGHGGDTYGFISDQGFIPQLNATWSWVANSDAGISNFDVTCNIITTATKFVLGKEAPFHCSAGKDAMRASDVVV